MNKPSNRRLELEDRLLNGEEPKKAAIESGYSESYANVDVYRVLANPSFQERLATRRAELARRAEIKNEEILGALAQIATSSLGDILEEDGSFNLEKCRARGADHLLKKLKVTQRTIITGDDDPPVLETKYEFEAYDRLNAIAQLRDSFGLKQKERENEHDLTEAEKQAELARLYDEQREEDRRNAEKLIG